MAGCILRIRDSGFDAKSFLSDEEFEAEARFEDGFNLAVSDAERADQQVSEASAFIAANGSMLLRLRTLLDEPPVLDFGVFLRPGTLMVSTRLPASFVEQASAYGIGIEVSVYASDG